jgi:hypothetical protein
MMAVVEANAISSRSGPTTYWYQSRRPLASLFFALPLLLFYEGGVLWLGPDTMRNGADVWLQQLLGWLGFSGFLLLPLLTVAILLGWHHATREPWRVSGGVLYTMAAESTVLAIVLVGVAHLHAAVLSVAGVPARCELASATQSYLENMVRYFGAGIYEELLFRLILVPALTAAIGLVVVSQRVKVGGALLTTSLIFSAAHYVGPYGESLELYTFLFRFVAGGFFAILFVYRGFGIAAGTHALYDILVGFPTS